MSMYLEFEPHSWFYEFAIKFDPEPNDPCEWTYRVDRKDCYIHAKSAWVYEDHCEGYAPRWSAFCEDGNTYSIVELTADTLKELKGKIVAYWLRDGIEHAPAFYGKRLLKSKEKYNV